MNSLTFRYFKRPDSFSYFQLASYPPMLATHIRVTVLILRLTKTCNRIFYYSQSIEYRTLLTVGYLFIFSSDLNYSKYDHTECLKRGRTRSHDNIELRLTIFIFFVVVDTSNLTFISINIR